MAELNSPLTLVSAALFQAPGDRAIHPYSIPDHQEVVEILTAGKVFFDTEDGREELWERGTIFWHIAGDATIHKTPFDAPYQCLALKFQVQHNRRTIPRVSCWADELALDGFVSEVIRRFHDESIDHALLCEYVHRRIYWESYIGERRTQATAYPPLLVKALQLLQNSLSGDLTVRDIADRIKVSEPYLYTLFNKYLQSSPHQYLLNLRLREAKIRLSTGNDDIKLIAAQCGFDNLESFYRAFRKNTGVPPGEYRRRQQPNSN